MVELIGTEKQIEWATKIRAEAVKQLDASPARLAEGAVKAKEIAASKSSAAWWIETGRYVQWAAVVRRCQKGEEVTL